MWLCLRRQWLCIWNALAIDKDHPLPICECHLSSTGVRGLDQGVGEKTAV